VKVAHSELFSGKSTKLVEVPTDSVVGLSPYPHTNQLTPILSGLNWWARIFI